MYCGTEFLISETKPDIHYHMGERVGTIENFIALAISMIETGDMEASKGYFLKAREIDLPSANEAIAKRGADITRAYLSYAEAYDMTLFQTTPVPKMTQEGKNPEVEADRMIAPLVKPSADALETALNWVDQLKCSNEDRALLFSDYCTGQGIHHMALNHLWNNFFSRPRAERKTAVEQFQNALKYNPDNPKAIGNLKGLNVTCPACKGSGMCRKCKGSGLCRRCVGSGKCPKCGSVGRRTGLFGKEKECGSCRGSGMCKECGGAKECPECGGGKVCPQCGGRGV